MVAVMTVVAMSCVDYDLGIGGRNGKQGKNRDEQAGTKSFHIRLENNSARSVVPHSYWPSRMAPPSAVSAAMIEAHQAVSSSSRRVRSSD